MTKQIAIATDNDGYLVPMTITDGKVTVPVEVLNSMLTRPAEVVDLYEVKPQMHSGIFTSDSQFRGQA